MHVALNGVGVYDLFVGLSSTWASFIWARAPNHLYFAPEMIVRYQMRYVVQILADSAATRAFEDRSPVLFRSEVVVLPSFPSYPPDVNVP